MNICFVAWIIVSCTLAESASKMFPQTEDQRQNLLILLPLDRNYCWSACRVRMSVHKALDLSGHQFMKYHPPQD